jgi:hypothetical protein
MKNRSWLVVRYRLAVRLCRAAHTPFRRQVPPGLSIPRIDAICPNGVVYPFSYVGTYCCDALENRRVDGKRRFLDSLLPPVDRFGTREKKHHPGWILGVQPPGQPISSQLLSLLSARFGWGDHDIDAASSLYQKSLSEMAGGTDREEGGT